MGKLSCGSCSACCFLLEIEELSKPYCKWCTHAKPAEGGGCTIYEKRPDPCRNFKCLWLISQDRPGQEMPLSMRPNHSHVMFNTSPYDSRHIYAHVFPSYPQSYKKGKVWNKIQDLISRGGVVEVIVGNWRNLMRAGKPTIRFHEEIFDQAKTDQLRKDLGIITTPTKEK